jgi:hypothetical protein
MVLGLIGVDGLYALTPAANADALDRAVKDAVDLTKTAPVKEALRVREVRWSGARQAEIGYGEKKTASLKWATVDGRAKVTLTSGTPPEKSLGDDANLAAAIKALGAGVTFAAVVQPLKLDATKALLGTAPLVLGYGTKEGRIWAHADITDALLREVSKARMGL